MAYYEVGNPEAENLVILTHGMSGWACVAAAAAAPPPWRKASPPACRHPRLSASPRSDDHVSAGTSTGA